MLNIFGTSSQINNHTTVTFQRDITIHQTVHSDNLYFISDIFVCKLMKHTLLQKSMRSLVTHFIILNCCLSPSENQMCLMLGIVRNSFRTDVDYIFLPPSLSQRSWSDKGKVFVHLIIKT